MKYIKTFEEINIEEPQAGDWVICNEENYLKDFLNNNIGFCYNYNDNNLDEEFRYRVLYPDNIPEDIEDEFNRIDYKGENVMMRIFNKKEILYWTKDKKELETILAAKKYNIS